jgi:hypothetical protein
LNVHGFDFYNYKSSQFFSSLFCSFYCRCCRMLFLNIQLLVQWSGLMQRIHFFYSIQVGAPENLRYLCAVIAVMFLFSSFYAQAFRILISNNVSKRVLSIPLVVIWYTLQQHLSMHLTTSHLTSTGILS